VDWVLRMARVREQDFLDAIAARSALTPDLLDALADSVAGYHAKCPVLHPDQHEGLRAIADGNLRSALAAGLPEAPVRHWHRAMLHALDQRRDWLAAREQAGFVRRAHGDLHLANLCLWDGVPVPFDALEFDEALATIDLGYDLAFLLMDLDQAAGRAAANRVMNRYIARTGDDGMTAGLPAFLSMRALIRAHVLAASGKPGAPDFLAIAAERLRPPPPVVVAIGGLQATGKTTLARVLAPELGAAPGALIIRSDEVRKRLHGAAPEQRLPESAYSPEANARVDAAIAGSVRRVAGGGHAVVVDATFRDPALRRAVETAARDAGAPFHGFWLEAPLEVLEARIAARRGDASDADVAVLRRAVQNDSGPGDWRPVPAEDGAAALASVRRAIASG
jgi:predicted kinase